MKTLTQPGSKIISTGGDMLKVLAEHQDRGYDKEKLGFLVAYYGGNKLLKKDNTLFICEQIEEAEIE